MFLSLFSLLICLGVFHFCFSLFWGKNQTQMQIVQVYDYLYVQGFHFHLFGFIFLCVLPTTIGSESTNCDDPYQWYTMHRKIKFVMIPDGSSTAPAYSLWQTLLSPPVIYPSLLDSLVCLHCVPATGRDSGASAQPPLPHLMPFLPLHLHGASGLVYAVTQLGLTARSSLRGMQETTQRQSCRATHPLGARSCPCAGLP